MPKSRKRARTDGAADGGEHRRESAHLLLHAPPATETASAPLIDPEGGDSLLAALAWPLSAADFLQQCFRRKAVATVAPAGSAAARFAASPGPPPSARSGSSGRRGDGGRSGAGRTVGSTRAAKTRGAAAVV